MRINYWYEGTIIHEDVTSKDSVVLPRKGEWVSIEGKQYSIWTIKHIVDQDKIDIILD